METTLKIPLTPAPLAPGLYLIATPLGNLRDITVRALEALHGVTAIYCEDTRVSAVLLRHYGIDKALRRYDDHASGAARDAILDQLGNTAIALISDAGTPLINDPGFKLARAAIAAGHMVTALPGPSAPILALSLSGLPTDRFTFAGYLPSKAVARASMCQELAQLGHSIIVFESPHRLSAGLEALAQAMPGRDAAVCREMTKRFEEIDRAPLPQLAERWASKTAKGEIVIVIGPAPEAPPAGDADIDAAIHAALADGQSMKESAADVAKALNLPRRQVYQRALALTKTSQS